MYAVLVTRKTLHAMERAERAEVDAQLTLLHDKGLIVRQDRIDNVNEEIAGVMYFTDDTEILRVLNDISRDGYRGFSNNHTLINQLIEGT